MMNNRKNDVEVIINNKIYTLCGFESDEYLQKVASYINSKYSEFRSREEFTNLNNEMRNILIEINIADDYFKAKKQGEEYLNEINDKNKEIFDLKHEIISIQTKNDNMHKEYEMLKDEMEIARKNLIKLEAELNETKKTAVSKAK